MKQSNIRPQSYWHCYRNNPEAGSTIIAAISAATVVTAIASVIMASLWQQTVARKTEATNRSREVLVAKLRKDIRVGLTLYTSLTTGNLIKPGQVNEMLYRCMMDLQGDTPNDCPEGDKSDAAWIPARLINYDGVEVSGAGPTYKNLGNSGKTKVTLDAAFYDAQGGICDAKKDVCPFYVWTDFQARCGWDTPTCSVATGIYFRFHISPANSSQTGIVQDKTFIQYVPIEDDGAYGQWSVLAYDHVRMQSDFDYWQAQQAAADAAAAAAASSVTTTTVAATDSTTPASTTSDSTQTGGVVTDPGVAGSASTSDSSSAGDTSSTAASNGSDNSSAASSDSSSSSSSTTSSTATSSATDTTTGLTAGSCPPGTYISGGHCVSYSL